ncbi:MAG: hypothetical protein FWE72_01820 [Spirochaetaceae bacterium]|nr:hypothetical protein [Spirochaetaceae bacterium]
MKLRSIIILLFFLFIFSCNDSDIGIFYGLKNEEKIRDRSLPNEVTVGSMTRLGMNLYIGAGNIYTKTSQTEEEWRVVNPPSGFDLSVEVVSNGTNLYAIYYTKNSAKKGFFKLDGNVWEQITLGIPGTIESVKGANNQIFISTRINSNTAYLYHFDGTNNFPTQIINNMTGSLFNVIFDGTFYWIYNYNKIFSGNSPINPFTNIFSIEDHYEIKGIMELNNNIFFTYSSKRNLRGYIGVINSAGIKINEHNIGSFMLNGLKTFTVTGIEEGVNKEYKFLLCGTAGRGYYQLLNPSENNIELQRPRNNILSENYNSAIDLQNAVVLDFFIDPPDAPDGALYALTATKGLWKNTVDGGYRTWSIE